MLRDVEDPGKSSRRLRGEDDLFLVLRMHLVRLMSTVARFIRRCFGTLAIFLPDSSSP